MSKDVFDRCYSESGNFAEFRLNRDHYYAEPILNDIPSTKVTFDGTSMINWAINDYLGLANSEQIRQFAIDAVSEFGLSAPMGARMLTGTSKYHLELENMFAKYLQKESAMLHNYGYLGVMGVISALTGPGDSIVIDSLSHSCMIDGAYIAVGRQQVKLFPFKHNDMSDLERQLEMASKNSGGILIIVEGVYGMKGELAPLDKICALKKKYHARLFVDDAHGFGVMGSSGIGTGNHFGVQDEIDLYFGTFAKAFVNIGGVTAGSKEVIDYLRYNSRPDLSSKSLPLAVVKTVMNTLPLVTDHARRDQMWYIAKSLQEGLRNLGFNLGDTHSPITPIHFSSSDMNYTKTAIRYLREQHQIFVTAVAYPIVPMGEIIFRLIPTANHTLEDIDKTLIAFKELRDL